MRNYAITSLMGLTLGAALSFGGFSDFAEIHRMFTFQDLRMIYIFGGAVTLNVLAFAVLQRGKRPAKRVVDWTALVGGIVFGLGWALCGASPATALVQLGEGKLYAGVAIVGIVAGNWICSKLQQRFSFAVEACTDAPVGAR